MARSPTDSDSGNSDHLSNLADSVLIIILSLLPTDMAARTSVLSSRFRHLWEASSSLDLTCQPDRADNFRAMADRTLLRRDPSYPLVSLRLDLQHFGDQDSPSFAEFISSLLYKAHSLRVEHLTIQGLDAYHHLSSLLRVLFSCMNTLKSLSIDAFPLLTVLCFEDGIFPPPSKFATLSTCLTSLSLTLTFFDRCVLSQLLSQLSSLKDLHLVLNNTPLPMVMLYSRTVANLKLIINAGLTKNSSPIELCFPSLESLHLVIEGPHTVLHRCHGEVPLLKKAVIALDALRAEDVGSVHQLLNVISHVEDLALHFKQSEDEKVPIPTLLEPGKDAPNFFNLKHLHVTACFHPGNLEALVTMLHYSPALESLYLLHELPAGREGISWESQLPFNDDGNNRYGYFRDLHLGDNRKGFMELLSKKCVSKF